jgi:hypothetical protein
MTLESTDPDPSPSRRPRGLNIGSVVVVLVLGLLATCAISNVRDRIRRDGLEQALAPLNEEWSALRQQAGPRLASFEALLGNREAPREDGCAGLTGVVSVIHRPMLSELAAGASAPRPGPLWLSSDAYQYLALALTPGREIEAHRRRNEAVRAALEQPCIGVLDADQAASARPVDAHQFEGGEVSGRLRIVCVDDARIACEVAIESRPNFAVSLVQRDSRVQAGADASAVDEAASRAYWKAVEAALAGRAGGLRVERAPAIAR